MAQAERDAAEREAQVIVQEKEALRRTKELEATVVATATASRQTAIIDAEAAKQKRILDADAEAEYLKRTAQAKRDAATLEGEGEANRRKSVLLAEAEGNAAAKKQALLAEAEGTQKLAEALAQMSSDARFILVLDKLPGLLDHGGEAGAKLLQAIFGPAAAAIAQIDKISIVDVGGNGQGLGKVSGMVPQAVFQVLAQLEALGLDVKGLLKLLKIDPSGIENLLAGLRPGGAAEPAGSEKKGASSVDLPTVPTGRENGAQG